MDMRIIDVMSILSFEKREKDLNLVKYILKKYTDGMGLAKKPSDILPFLEVNDRQDFINIVAELR